MGQYSTGAPFGAKNLLRARPGLRYNSRNHAQEGDAAMPITSGLSPQEYQERLNALQE